MGKSDTYNSLKPLTWLLKIFLINCNLREVMISKPLYISKIILMMLLIGAINGYCLYYKISNVYKMINPSIKFTDASQMIYDYFQYIIDLWCVYKYDMNLSIKYFKQYEIFDQILMISDFSKLKWRLAKLVGFFIAIWIGSSFCDYVTWGFSYGWITSSMYAISYVFLLIKIATTLDLTSHVMHIEIRLSHMTDIVHQYFRKAENLPGVIINKGIEDCWHLESQFRLRPQTKCSVVQPKSEYCDLNLLSRCYLMLTDQVALLNKMFGIRIMLNSLSLLIDMIRFTNIAVRIAIGNQQTIYNSGILPIIANFLRQVTCVFVLFSLVQHCENAYSESAKIVNSIDHLLVNKKIDEKVCAAMKHLREIVLSRPIKFNMANYFLLNNSSLLSIASVFVTYTIILLQSS